MHHYTQLPDSLALKCVNPTTHTLRTCRVMSLRAYLMLLIPAGPISLCP